MPQSRGARGTRLPSYHTALAIVTGVYQHHVARSTTPVPPDYLAEHEERILAEQARVQAEMQRLGLRKDGDA